MKKKYLINNQYNNILFSNIILMHVFKFFSYEYYFNYEQSLYNSKVDDKIFESKRSKVINEILIFFYI